MSSFFDLCPDILLHLFTYFSLNELYDIFFDIIPHLSILLIKGHVKLHINKNCNEHFWNNILSQINLTQVISLNIDYSKINEINLSQFASLRSITLEDFRMINSLSLHPINQLIYLEQLSIKLSDTILNEDVWLSHILQLSNLKQLKIDLMIQKNTIIPQRDINISQLLLQSSTIKYLEIKIPLSWTSVISLLHHFPVLQIFRAYLYRINSNSNDTLISRPNLTCFHSLKTLDLTGYFSNMSSIITFFCSSMFHLKNCRLMATSVSNDDIFDIIMLGHHFFWNRLFQSCQDLIHVKIHMLMSIESQKNNDVENIKDLIRSFNDDVYCKQYKLYIIKSSIHNGYITLTCNFNTKNK